MHETFSEPLPSWIRPERVPARVGTQVTACLVARVATVAQCREALAFSRARGLTVCPRGSGHSYGDLPLNAGGLLLDTTAMNRILDFNPDAGTIRVEGGARIIDIYRRVHGEGWALPASPTESIITVAGAIAANVNGKDAWRVGNFGDQVLGLTLLTADGAIRTVDPARNRDLFLAVVGGLGMLGVVLDVSLSLVRVPSPWLRIRRRPVTDVAALVTALGEVEANNDFAVVWVDACARGRHLGRSVVHATRWVERDLDAAACRHAVDRGLARLETRRKHALAVYGLLRLLFAVGLEAQRLTVRFFNRLYYDLSRLRCVLGTADNEETFLRYNFDASFTVPPVALVCGPHGFTIQVCFPRERAEEAITSLLTICQAGPCRPVTTVLRLHRDDAHRISFTTDGYSLNFEFHPKRRHRAAMRACVDRLVARVTELGGRVHLAKDSVLRGDQFRALFPGAAAFQRVKNALDPAGLFSSNLYRRLFEEDAAPGA